MLTNSIRVGLFLAYRQIRRANIWTTVLVVFVMMLTFLNLVFVTGILIGLPIGASLAYSEEYSGDVLISNLETRDYILQSNEVLSIVKNLPQVSEYSARYITGGLMQANYKTRLSQQDKLDEVAVTVVGINPIDEDRLTHLSSFLVAGEYLNSDDEGYVLVGSNFLANYTRGIPGEDTVEDVDVGSRIRIKIGDKILKEVEVKGILKTKVAAVNRRVFFVDRELRKLIGRTDFNVDEIAIGLKEGVDPHDVTRLLRKSDVDMKGQVRTSLESQGDFLQDIETTFAVLGNFVGSIGVVVASITIFIVIFINAFARRKFIGILQGIGISDKAIEFSYILQGLFYAIIGSGLGIVLLYTILQPYFDRNPIDFPFSDGLLVAPFGTTMLRVGILIIATGFAAYFPVKLVTRKRILDSILGR